MITKISMTERQHRFLMERYNGIKISFFKINLCLTKCILKNSITSLFLFKKLFEIISKVFTTINTLIQLVLKLETQKTVQSNNTP